MNGLRRGATPANQINQRGPHTKGQGKGTAPDTEETTVKHPIRRAAAVLAAAALTTIPVLSADAQPRVSTAAGALAKHCGDPYWANTYNARGSVSALRYYDSAGNDHLVGQGKTGRIDACLIKVGAHRGIVAYDGHKQVLLVRNTRSIPVWVLPGQTVKTVAKVVVFKVS